MVDWGGVVAWRVRGRGIIAAWKADSPLRAPGGVCSRSGAPRSLTERAPRHAVVAVAVVAKRVCARPGEGAWWAGAAGGGQAALRCRDRYHVPEILRADTAPAEAVLACIVIRAAAVQQPGDPLDVRDTREVQRSGCAPRERHGTVPLDSRGRVSHEDRAVPPQRVEPFVCASCERSESAALVCGASHVSSQAPLAPVPRSRREPKGVAVG